MMFKIMNESGEDELAAPTGISQEPYGLKIQFNNRGAVVVDTSLRSIECAMNDAARDGKEIVDVTPDGIEEINNLYRYSVPEWTNGGASVQKRRAP